MISQVLKKVTNYYLNSRDFNGLPLSALNDNEKLLILQLIDDRKVEVLSDKFVINPHIRAFSLNIPKDQQKQEVIKAGSYVVIYPSESHLKSLNLIDEKPFTQMIINGDPKLKIMYFNIEILEMYFQNPKFKIFSHDYRGSIIISDDFHDEADDAEYIKDFGIGYHKEKGNTERVVCAFLDDLSKLSYKAQLKWKIHLIDNQDFYYANKGFYKNLILGEWIDEVSIYDALLDEMKVINKMCENMELPKLFNKEFTSHSHEKPEDYRIIFLPTLKNYYSFVMSLEKMIIDNLNYKTFLKNSLYIGSLNRNDENGNPKGSLNMLSEWLTMNINTNENLEELIINPLKELRKVRQVPAHELYSNTYDKTLYKKQNDLITKSYSALRSIRLFFANHPLNKGINIPKYLIKGENIVIY
jgi:hypothetical protein